MCRHRLLIEQFGFRCWFYELVCDRLTLIKNRRFLRQHLKMTPSDIKILNEIKRTEVELKSVILEFENLREGLKTNNREKAQSAIHEIEQYVSPWNGKLMFDCPTLPENEG